MRKQVQQEHKIQAELDVYTRATRRHSSRLMSEGVFLSNSIRSSSAWPSATPGTRLAEIIA